MADRSEDRGASHAMFGLNDPEPRRAAPAEAPPVIPATGPPPPQYIYVQGPPPSPPVANTSSGVGKVIPALVVLLLLLSGITLYLGISSHRQFTDVQSKQDDQMNLLTRRLDSSDQRYAQLKGQFQVTTERLGLTQAELGRARTLASNIERRQQDAVQQLNQAIAQKASADQVNKLQSEADSKFGSLNGDLAGTKKDLADAKASFDSALTGTKGELTGAIARTHDELVQLAHRSDRDFFEFNVRGKKSQQKVGTVTIQLTKTDVKKNLYGVNLVFDDKGHPHKDRTTNEPLMFYVQGAPSSLELVVNKLGRDSISGYISAPKGFFTGTPNVLGARPSA